MGRKKNQRTEEVEVILNDDNPDDLGFGDWQAPDDQLDAEIYPFAQWNNNEAKWEFPLEHWGGSLIDQNYDTVEVAHDFGQSTEPAMLVPVIHIAVIAQRVTWEKNEPDGKRVYSATYEKGMHKRYNFLCLIKETESPDPVIITARSYTGSYIQNAIKQHRSSVLKMASRLTKGMRYPTYMFWLPLVAAPKKVLVGGEKKSPIQPPVPAFEDLAGISQAGITDLVKSLYIGNEYRDIISEYLYPEGESWANEYQQLQLAAGNGGDISNEAQVLPGGILLLPDLSTKKEKEWVTCAMSIPGLFTADQHASNALGKFLRENRHLSNNADKWEAFSKEITARFDEMTENNRTVEVEMQLQAGG